MQGKIESKELFNRRYDNDTKSCIGFEYNLQIEKEDGLPDVLQFYFNRLAEKYWEVSVISKKASIGELRAYSCQYEIPVKSMVLEMVAAIGLTNIQYLLKQEVQYKSMIDFCIGDAVSNM